MMLAWCWWSLYASVDVDCLVSLRKHHCLLGVNRILSGGCGVGGKPANQTIFPSINPRNSLFVANFVLLTVPLPPSTCHPLDWCVQIINNCSKDKQRGTNPSNVPLDVHLCLSYVLCKWSLNVTGAIQAIWTTSTSGLCLFDQTDMTPFLSVCCRNGSFTGWQCRQCLNRKEHTRPPQTSPSTLPPTHDDDDHHHPLQITMNFNQSSSNWSVGV